MASNLRDQLKELRDKLRGAPNTPLLTSETNPILALFADCLYQLMPAPAVAPGRPTIAAPPSAPGPATATPKP